MTIRSELFRSLALAVLLSVGAGLVWGMVFGFGFGVVSSFVSSPEVHEELVFTREGSPLVESYEIPNYEARKYRALDGKPVDISKYELGYYPTLMGPIDQRKRFFHPTWSYRIAVFQNNGFDPEKWYFICDGKQQAYGYVVGYDKAAKARIGYIGRRGFRSDKPPREDQFPVDGRKISQKTCRALMFFGSEKGGRQYSNYLITENGLVQIDLKKRTAKLVHQQTDLISAALTTYMPIDTEEAKDKKKTCRAIILRMPESILAIDPGGKEIRTYPLPTELRNAGLTFVPLQDDKALVQKHSELLWIDTTGKIVKRKRVDLHERSRISNTTQSLVMSVCLPSVGIISGVFVCYPWGPAESHSLGYWAALSKGLHMYWPMLLITGVICVILAILCYRRQRKYGLPWTWVWTGFVLFFGLPAYLGYLAHRSWPARLACPSCGEAAPRDREACFSCRQDFPAPVPKGIEVFT